MGRTLFLVLSFCGVCGCATVEGGAGGVGLSASRRADFSQLRFDAKVDVPAGLLLGTTGASLVALRPMLATRPCQFSCTPQQVNLLDTQVRQARWSDPTAARTVGDAVGYGALPAFVLVSGLIGLSEGQSMREALEDFWIIGEAFALSHVLESTLKYTTARARPDTTFALPGAPVADASDLYTSMVSGHATAGFAIAVATGVVASMRRRPSAPWLWLAGLSIATASSYLRIAADRHYLTDVLAGAALGSAVGVAVPLLFHGASAPVTFAPQVSNTGGGLAVSGRF